MNKQQILLKKWIDKNFEGIEIEFEDKDSATIIDYKKERMKIRLNEYYDIIEVDTNKKLAISDLDHEKTPENERPQTWRELPYK